MLSIGGELYLRGSTRQIAAAKPLSRQSMRGSVQLLATNETGVNELIRKNVRYATIPILTAGALFATALPAQAAEIVPPSQVIISPDTSVSSADLSYEQLMERLQSVEPGSDTAQTAAILFPDDAVTQQQFIDVANSVDSGIQEGGVVQPQALPAALAPFVAAVGLCH